MPARHLATFTVTDAEMMPAFMPGDVWHYDPAKPLDLLSRDNTSHRAATAPLDLSCRHDKLRVVMLTGDGLQACVLDGPLPQNVLAAWPVQWVVAR